jgi:hypothetical protein
MPPEPEQPRDDAGAFQPGLERERRRARLAAALRENLSRRKRRARRDSEAPMAAVEPDDEG